MADEQQVQTQETQPVNLSERLQSEVWGDAPVQEQQSQEPAPAEQQQMQPELQVQQPENSQPSFDPKDWLKKEFEVEDAEIIKQQLKEYKELKEKPATQDYKFENDESRDLAEAISKGDRKKVIDILQKQEEIAAYTSGEVTKENADSIIKLGLKMKHPTLTKDQIEFQFNEDYGTPRKPQMKDTEDETEFAERLSEWQSQVDRVEMKKTIAATMAVPDLQRMKAEIKLPQIESNQVANQQPTQEDVEAFEKSKAAFLQSSESFLKDFNGFSVSVKDKDVDYTVGYAPSKEEKEMITSGFKEFAENGYDANVLFAQRWVNQDKTLNIQQMVKDYLRIVSGEKADTKFANEAANQRLELYIKEKKSINLNDTRVQDDFNPNTKTTSQVLQEQFWGT